MKKTAITVIALLALAYFGMASSAQAFYVQVSDTAAEIIGNTLVLNTTPPMYDEGLLMGINTPKGKSNNQWVVCTPVKYQKENQAERQVRNFVILPLLVPGGGVPS